ncbi:MAG: N-acetylmuramoyl-L-alanine amidase-like domain-containing protein [Neisseriaceae bacterium]
MFKKISGWVSVLLIFFCMPLGCARGIIDEPFPEVDTNDASLKTIQHVLKEVKPQASNPQDAIEKISGSFLGTPYVANRLIGSPEKKEILVVDLTGLDCFTYIDYIEAFKQSQEPADFFARLIKVRYKRGQVDYQFRKHFFTDWANARTRQAQDITRLLSKDAVQVTKLLNKNPKGGVYLPGIPVVRRVISYIPSAAVNEKVIEQLRTGDYIGAYTPLEGLDVTHVGIFILSPEGPVFRNASSRKENMKVVDTPLSEYLKRVPGIVVLRPLH